MAGPRLKRDGVGNPMSPGQLNACNAEYKRRGRIARTYIYIVKAQQAKEHRVGKYIRMRLYMRDIRNIDEVTGEHNNWRDRHVKPGVSVVIKRRGVKVASIAGYDIYSMHEPLKHAVVAKELAPFIRRVFLEALKKRGTYYLTIKVLAPAT